MRLVVWIPAAAWIALIVTGVIILIAQRHREPVVTREPIEVYDDGYVGRHRAGLLSTMQLVAGYSARPVVRAELVRAHLVALDDTQVLGPELGEHGHMLELHDRGARLPQPRRSLADALDEWTAEHGLIAA